MYEPNNVINNFFYSLSTRGNENYLSDVIAAACNSSFTFKKIFLEFIFQNDNIMSKCPSEIEREFTKNNGKIRFDFYFTTTDGTEYIIENKIYDRNDHYEDYSTIKLEHIGFIANYDVSNIKYLNKHKWQDFYNELKKALNIFSEDEKRLAESLLNYIQGVCGIMEQRKFNITDLNDLGYFIQILKEIMKEKGYSINNKAKGSSEVRIGFWGYKEPRSYWFGIYLSEDRNEGFSICGGIYNTKLQNIKSKKLIYSDFSNYNNDNSNWFKLKENYLQKLNGKSTEYSKEIEIIQNFIDEVESIK